MDWLEDRMPHWRLILIAGLLGLGALAPLLITVSDLMTCGQPPSEAMIRRGVGTYVLNRRLNLWASISAPLKQCDQTCYEQLAIEMTAIDGCHHAALPSMQENAPTEEYWEVTVDILAQPGPGRTTLRFWESPEGWNIQGPEMYPIIVINEAGAYSRGIPFQ